MATSDDVGRGVLVSWMAGASGDGRRAGSGGVADGVRFAFYGCVGGADPEGPEVSEAWQREMAERTIAGQGVIVAGFFDVGVTSRLSWSDRPQGAALRATAGDSNRGFSAVVVGDYERAFGTVAEFEELVRLFDDHGIQVWMPEAGGLVSVDSPDFRALLTVLQSVVHSPAVRGAGAGRRRSGGEGGRRVRR